MIQQRLLLAFLTLSLWIPGNVATAGATGVAGCCVCTCLEPAQVACFDDVSDRDCEVGAACSPDATTSFLDDPCTGQHVDGACAEVPACAAATGGVMAPAASALALGGLAVVLAGIGLLRRRR